MGKVAIVYHSTNGHTERLARAVLAGAASVDGTEAQLMTVEEGLSRLDELDDADAIIFGCPTYMGGMSAQMKAFVDASEVKWAASEWKDKVAGAFTTSGSFSGDNFSTLMGLIVNAMQHGMVYVGVTTRAAENESEPQVGLDGPKATAHNRIGASVGVVGTSFKEDATTAPGRGDLETAEAYGSRVAQISARLVGCV